MASIAERGAKPRVQPISADMFERALAVLALLLLAAALRRGHARWDEIPPLVWAHLATVALSLAITPALMLHRRGDGWHRRLGWLIAGFFTFPFERLLGSWLFG